MTVSGPTFTYCNGRNSLMLHEARPVASTEEATRIKRGISPMISAMLDKHPAMTWFLLGRFTEPLRNGDAQTTLSRVAVPLYKQPEGPLFGMTGLVDQHAMWGLGWQDISDFGRRRMPNRLAEAGLVPTLRLDILGTNRTWLLWRLKQT